MKKIPTIYRRDPATKLRYVMDERDPDCQWVFDGEGTPTYKWDGTAVLIDDDGEMWKRREVKPGRPEPAGFRQEGEPDPNTGKRVGWVPVSPGDPADQWHREALARLVSDWHDTTDSYWPEGAVGTYELIGPKIQGNPHGLDEHMLIRHGTDPLYPVPTSFGDLARWLHSPAVDHGPLESGFEGVVWHHPDGRMAKIKVKDFPKSGDRDE